MARRDDGLRLTPKEIAATFADPEHASRYPPVMSIDEAADLLRTPKATLYDWSSRGLLKGCARRLGKRLLFFRDRLIAHMFNGSFDEK